MAWQLLAQPALWSSWAPHIRGARGLGDPEVRAGARGFVRLGPGVPVPARILATDPPNWWDWRVGPVTMRHRVRALGSDAYEVSIELSAPVLIEAAVHAGYGPVITLLLHNLTRVAGRPQEP
jgi:hypothetical protein